MMINEMYQKLEAENNANLMEMEMLAIPEKLKAQAKAFLKEEKEFKSCDLVVYKDGLQDRSFPPYDTPIVFLRYLEEDEIEEDTRNFDPDDMLCGIITPRGFATYTFSSRRFRKFNEV